MRTCSRSEEYRNLLKAQRALMADIENEGTCAKDRAACARVMVSVIDMKRVMRMKPKPKDIDVTKLAPRRRPGRIGRADEPFTPVVAEASQKEGHNNS